MTLFKILCIVALAFFAVAIAITVFTFVKNFRRYKKNKKDSGSGEAGQPKSRDR